MSDTGFASAARKSVIYFILIGTFALIGFRLFQMQILQQESYEEKSADNSIKSIEQIPLRGVFFDRNMEVIVTNIPAYTL
ncbi:MAG: penicillin-binding protein 2, partial [Ignavibacteriales bacterium]